MRNIGTLIKKDITIKIVSLLVFLCICFYVLCGVTYLFRNTGYDRNHVIGIKSEPNNIDMVYIGGSAAFTFWEPLKAWTDCGFTSYSLATNTIQAEMIKTYMEEAEKYQNPQLYVIGIRAFQYYADEQVEAGLRNGSDSMNVISRDRYQLLSDYFQHRITDENTDKVSYYFDVAKYHTNTGNLASSTAWGFLHNKGISPNKGWEWIDSYGYLDEPKDFQTDERAPLLDNAMETLNELVSYCKQIDKDVLFVVCPYEITKEDYAKYNTVKDVVEKAGFKYLNANDYYDEMGIDYSEDFYNVAHVNLFGAKKYTKFLEEYICKQYDMPDHRGDVSFSSWNDDADRFFEEEKVHAQTVTNLRLNYEKGKILADEIIRTENLSEWDNLVSDSRYVLLIAGKGSIDYPERIVDQNIFSKWGITENENDIIRVVSNSIVSYSNAEDAQQTYSTSEGLIYTINLESNVIEVFDEKIPISRDEISIVLVDNTYQKIIEEAVLDFEPEGVMVRRK